MTSLKRLLGVSVPLLGLPLSGAICGGLPQTGPGSSAEACCACLADNVCIVATDEQTCTDDLTSGENPDREQRPFGEGIALNQDCHATSCASCADALLQ